LAASPTDDLLCHVNEPLRLEFDGRDDLHRYLCETFPASAQIDDRLSATVGGLRAAQRTLAAIEPAVYARTRNHLDGAVTQLSPYLRHGVLGLVEVRDAALRRVGQRYEAQKLVQELAWRDYFQHCWHALGDAVWKDVEPYKTGLSPSDYADELPADIRAGTTGVDYIDAFVAELHETGYLHNHARMWLASYVVHGRRVKWQAGARWFLEHLLDGDEASNNLSWQWVASTFAAKPYIFNRENVVRNAGDRFPVHSRVDPFDDSYERITERMFPVGMPDARPPKRVRAVASADRRGDVGNAVVWVHDGMLSHEHPALRHGGPAIFVYDEAWCATASLKRIAFIHECLLEMPGVRVVRSSDVPRTLIDFAQEHGAIQLVTSTSPDPRVRRTIEAIEASLPVITIDRPAFAELREGQDLPRFSRYWSKVERQVAASTR
jgi:deoxyribodipyrimidine photo-lyase